MWGFRTIYGNAQNTSYTTKQQLQVFPSTFGNKIHPLSSLTPVIHHPPSTWAPSLRPRAMQHGGCFQRNAARTAAAATGFGSVVTLAQAHARQHTAPRDAKARPKNKAIQNTIHYNCMAQYSII